MISEDARLAKIARLLEQVDVRCMAADGPVTPGNEEITAKELRDIYVLASGKADKREECALLGMNETETFQYLGIRLGVFVPVEDPDNSSHDDYIPLQRGEIWFGN